MDMTPIEAVQISLTNASSFVYSQANWPIGGFGYEGTTAIPPNVGHGHDECTDWVEQLYDDAVAMSDQYMMWAGYLGSAKGAAKQFNFVDPSCFEHASPTYNTALTSMHFRNHVHVRMSRPVPSRQARRPISQEKGRSAAMGGRNPLTGFEAKSVTICA